MREVDVRRAGSGEARDAVTRQRAGDAMRYLPSMRANKPLRFQT